MEETLEDALAVFALPEGHRTRMRTNNGLERFHEEIRRRTRVVRIFPNRASCLRLCSALAMEQSEEWITGHRYLDMDRLEEHQFEEVEIPLFEAAVV
jgi:transposase-like protein